MAAKKTLLAINTGTLTPLSDAALAQYDYIITQYDRQSRMAGVKALNPSQKWYVYQNTLMANAIGSSGVSKAQMDANPSWYFRTLSTEPFESSVLRDSPVHFWKLQEASGTSAADAGSSPSNGTYDAGQTLGAASLTGNAALKSVTFNGTSGIVTPFTISESQPYTFEGWAVVSDLSVPRSLFGSDGSSGHRILLRVQTNRDIIFWTDTSGAGVAQSWATAAPTAGTIFHWALTWNPTTLTAELFINGVSKGTRTFPSGFGTGSLVGNLVIGAWHTDHVHDPLNGRLSHISVNNLVLGAGRIGAHYSNGPNTTTGGGAIIESVLFPGNWLADASQSGYQSQWESNVISLLVSGGWDGVFADDIDLHPFGHAGSATIADPANAYSALTEATFDTNQRAFLVNMYAAIHAAGKEVIGNISNSFDQAGFVDLVGILDGSTREFYMKFGTGDSSGIAPVQPSSGDSRFITSDYDYTQGFLPATQTAGKRWIGITYGVATDLKIQRYINASFLLDWDGTSDSSIAFALSTTADPNNAAWMKKIGTPTGAKFTVLSDPHCWMRNYTGGVVCVNATAASKTFDLSAYPSLLKADGTPVGATSIVIPAGEGEILSFTSGSETGTGAQTGTLAAAPQASESATSVESGAVSGSVPQVVIPPSIAGTAQEGYVLNGNRGTWNLDPTSYTYQWVRCDTNGLSCVPIPGATSLDYMIVADDVGHRLKLQVTATNPFGSTTNESLATAVVVGAPAPITPPEVEPTDAELNFMDEEPPGFFPQNQDSNWGLKRRIFTDQIQAGADQLTTLYAEKFVGTSNAYLDEWEKEVGLPPASPGLDVGTRRSRILGRLRQGPFTRARRIEIIERYIAATFGDVPAFGPSGIPILGGIPLHSFAGSVKQLYRVYEDLANFRYYIYIDSGVGVDVAGMTRELDFITPSGISYVLDNSHAGTGIIQWDKTLLTYSPSGWWKLGADYNDYSGNANNGTVTGAPTLIASPGLIVPTGGDGARDFSGSGQYVSIPYSASLDITSQITLFAVIRPDAFPGAGSYGIAYANESGTYIGIQNSGTATRLVFSVRINGTSQQVFGTTSLVAGTTYFVTGTYQGNQVKLYLNGILERAVTVPYGSITGTGNKAIANDGFGSSLFNGALDEVVVINYALGSDDVLFVSNQARGIL